MSLVFRDLRKTLKRFGIELDPTDLTGEKDELYHVAAEKVFSYDHDIVAFIYGHTHKPSIENVNGKCIINTGTWLKQFSRAAPRFGFLPAIYVPSFCLNYFKIGVENNKIAVEYHKIDKTAAVELTLVQRMMVSRRKRKTRTSLPKRTILKI